MEKILAFKGNNAQFKDFIDSLNIDKQDEIMDVNQTEFHMGEQLENITEITLDMRQIYGDVKDIYKKMKELEIEFDAKTNEYMKLVPQLNDARCELLKLSQKYREQMTVSKDKGAI